MNPPGPSRLLGIGQRVGVGAAAFVNGALSQALEFDDTHNESIVHMSSPAVAAALALAESEHDIRARADHRHCAGQRDLVPRRQCGAWPVSPARVSSHRLVRAVRRSLSRRAAARPGRASSSSMPPASSAASPRASSSAGSTARNRNFCTRAGRRKAASLRPISDAPVPPDPTRCSMAASACSLRTCRTAACRSRWIASPTRWAGAGRASTPRSSLFRRRM